MGSGDMVVVEYEDEDVRLSWQVGPEAGVEDVMLKEEEDGIGREEGILVVEEDAAE